MRTFSQAISGRHTLQLWWTLFSNTLFVMHTGWKFGGSQQDTFFSHAWESLFTAGFTPADSTEQQYVKESCSFLNALYHRSTGSDRHAASYAISKSLYCSVRWFASFIWHTRHNASPGLNCEWEPMRSGRKQGWKSKQSVSHSTFLQWTQATRDRNSCLWQRE